MANLCQEMKTEWELYPTCQFFSLNSKYSRSDKFARKKSVIIHVFSWSQKLLFMEPMINTHFSKKNNVLSNWGWAKRPPPPLSGKNVIPELG